MTATEAELIERSTLAFDAVTKAMAAAASGGDMNRVVWQHLDDHEELNVTDIAFSAIRLCTTLLALVGQRVGGDAMSAVLEGVKGRLESNHRAVVEAMRIEAERAGE